MTIAAVTAGNVIDPTTFGNAVVDQLNASTEWTSYTPTVSQGASVNIAKTVTYSSYVRSGPTGKTVTFSFQLALTAAGTAGSAVTVSVPVTAAASAMRGGGAVVDATVQNYGGAWIPASTTTISFFAHGGNAGSSWGVSPNVALASGDLLIGEITYEAA